jgi:ribosomal protein S27AE
MSAGKGDKPRNCFSSSFKNNYDEINWGEQQNKNSNSSIEFKKDKNFKILENKTCPQCNNAVRFNFKACGSCGYVFKK